ncbi:ATP-binding protein [uncultured Pseudodesulfovibrio sp.]|uniref:ATP-binding protein n=1 Tax=uncultured Pseudodesulfovibrio sp. TaxID=2035858 RepID=UPI0029C7D145|nr:ATP-binding protein [uncultured Pseudodesulfovibrio sp.]
MTRRFVLDGPPGSGKTTLLFGISDDSTGTASMQTLSNRGFNCIHESVARAHAILSRKGIDFNQEKELWLRAIIEIDRDKYLTATDDINFYDRCFHHWALLSRYSGIPLPSWYDDFNAEIRYDSPIFLLAPVKSMDLTTPDVHESRRFTWEQRQDIQESTRKLYRDLGYDVVAIPMYCEGDREQNNRKRIDRILEYIS